MTDLSTSNLKHLLAEQQSSLPSIQWTYKGGAANGIHRDYPSKHEELEVVRVGMELSPLALAAAAPDIAREVLRMREALHDLSEVWEAVSVNPARTPAEQNLAAAVVAHIDEILGDHDV